MGFSIWNDRNMRLGWDEMLEWFELLGIQPVPVLYDGIFDEQKIRGLWDDKAWGRSEGYVVSVADPIGYGEFRHKAGKFVRQGHIQTVKHCMHGQRIERNLLGGGEPRSEEHTSELQSLMRISYAVFCLKQKNTK